MLYVYFCNVFEILQSESLQYFKNLLNTVLIHYYQLLIVRDLIPLLNSHGRG